MLPVAAAIGLMIVENFGWARPFIERTPKARTLSQRRFGDKNRIEEGEQRAIPGQTMDTYSPKQIAKALSCLHEKAKAVAGKDLMLWFSPDERGWVSVPPVMDRRPERLGIVRATGIVLIEPFDLPHARRSAVFRQLQNWAHKPYATVEFENLDRCVRIDDLASPPTGMDLENLSFGEVRATIRIDVRALAADMAQQAKKMADKAVAPLPRDVHRIVFEAMA